MPQNILAICLDCGDTLIDEATEIKDGSEVSLRADLIPGADEMIKTLKERGYKLALVADGPVATFENNLGPYGLYDLFDVYAISETVGLVKPDSRIFSFALDQLNISKNKYDQVVMVGNNLRRDIRGANNLGIISVWLDWAPRRSKIPANSSEVLQYKIKRPLELLEIIDQLETE